MLSAGGALASAEARGRLGKPVFDPRPMLFILVACWAEVLEFAHGLLDVCAGDAHLQRRQGKRCLDANQRIPSQVVFGCILEETLLNRVLDWTLRLQEIQTDTPTHNCLNLGLGALKSSRPSWFMFAGLAVSSFGGTFGVLLAMGGRRGELVRGR